MARSFLLQCSLCKLLGTASPEYSGVTSDAGVPPSCKPESSSYPSLTLDILLINSAFILPGWSFNLSALIHWSISMFKSTKVMQAMLLLHTTILQNYILGLQNCPRAISVWQSLWWWSGDTKTFTFNHKDSCSTPLLQELSCACHKLLDIWTWKWQSNVVTRYTIKFTWVLLGNYAVA